MELNKVHNIDFLDNDLPDKCHPKHTEGGHCRYCGNNNILSFDNDKYCKDCDMYL